MASAADRSLRVSIVASCLLTSMAYGQRPTEQHQGHEVASRALIVKFKRGFVPNVAHAMSLHDLDRVEALTKNNDVFLFHSRSKDVAPLLKEVGAQGGIEYVEPNHIVRIRTVPNDPGFNQLWGLFNSVKPEADIGAASAWNISTGSSANVIGVVDTGIDYTHPTWPRTSGQRRGRLR